MGELLVRGRKAPMGRAIALIVALALAFGLSLPGLSQPEAAYAASAPTVTVGNANTGKVTVKTGSSYKLGAKATSGSKVTYSSSNKRVVTVSSKGTVKGVKSGKATVTIKAKRSGKTTTKKVKVTVVKSKSYKSVKALSAKLKSSSVVEGGSTSVSDSFKPSNASNRNVTYKSSNTSVVTVSASGKVYAKKPGTAKITVTSCANSKAKATVAITVRRNELSIAKWELDEATAWLNDAKEKVEYVKPYLDAAQENKDAAQLAYDEAKAAYDAIDPGELEDLETIMDEAKAAYDEAEGSSIVEFYKERGSNTAYAVLTGKNIDGTVNEDYGDPSGDDYREGYVDVVGSYGADDATSYENVLLALDQVDYYNELRKSVGLSEVKVVDSCMAVAQGNADYVTFMYETQGLSGHLGVGYGGENLAYNRNVASCWKEWYDIEKREFDAYYESVTGEKCELVGADAYNWYSKNPLQGRTFGHYLNIIDPLDQYTGIGRDSSSYTCCQQFCRWEPKGTEAYTVDEWRQQYIAWYEGTDCPKLKAAYEEAKAAYDEVNSIVVAYEDARDKLDKATKRLDSIKEYEASVLENLALAQTAYDEAKARYDSLA